MDETRDEVWDLISVIKRKEQLCNSNLLYDTVVKALVDVMEREYVDEWLWATIRCGCLVKARDIWYFDPPLADDAVRYLKNHKNIQPAIRLAHGTIEGIKSIPHQTYSEIEEVNIIPHQPDKTFKEGLRKFLEDARLWNLHRSCDYARVARYS